MCQTDPPDHPAECQAISMEKEDVPLFRKNLRKALDVDFIAAATKRDRNLQPLINMVRQQKWDQINACYGLYFYNVRDRLSVRNNVLLYDDRVVKSNHPRLDPPNSPGTRRHAGSCQAHLVSISP